MRPLTGPCLAPAIDKRSNIDVIDIFFNAKILSGAYNLEGTKANPERLTNLILLIDYTERPGFWA